RPAPFQDKETGLGPLRLKPEEPSNNYRPTHLGMNQMGELDTELWKRCAEDDPDALGMLFDRHSDAVFRYCLSRTGSWHDAEELVSVTFLEAWRQRKGLTLQRESLLPWLLGVATNAARNSARSTRRYEQVLGTLPHSFFVPDHSTATDERMDTERQVKELLEGAADLSTGERDVLLLCVMNGPVYDATGKTVVGEFVISYAAGNSGVSGEPAVECAGVPPTLGPGETYLCPGLSPVETGYPAIPVPSN
ncbi:RNA polymerase sigma factor, partial [Pseudarthrobacter cellobiosi]|uniref:RNA polymerase sigma factor n=1 Tax=Pseudarthrobacter cellobiosi TaxID=2953654 RepID=UPI00208E3A24